MSLWWCSSCKTLTGPDQYICSRCGNTLFYAAPSLYGEVGEGATTGIATEIATPCRGAQLLQSPDRPTLCWCRRLQDAGARADVKCEMCIRRALTEIYTLLHVTNQEDARKQLLVLTDRWDE